MCKPGTDTTDQDQDQDRDRDQDRDQDQDQDQAETQDHQSSACEVVLFSTVTPLEKLQIVHSTSTYISDFTITCEDIREPSEKYRF
jgi:hypothetical protein